MILGNHCKRVALHSTHRLGEMNGSPSQCPLLLGDCGPSSTWWSTVCDDNGATGWTLYQIVSRRMAQNGEREWERGRKETLILHLHTFRDDTFYHPYCCWVHASSVSPIVCAWVCFVSSAHHKTYIFLYTGILYASMVLYIPCEREALSNVLFLLVLLDQQVLYKSVSKGFFFLGIWIDNGSLLLY